jgi:hypothetical protein
MLPDGARDEARGDRSPIVVQYGHQADGIDAAFVDDQRAQLRVAVLLDDENEVVIADEARHARMEGKGADPKPVERLASRFDQTNGLVHGR